MVRNHAKEGQDLPILRAHLGKASRASYCNIPAALLLIPRRNARTAQDATQ